MSSKKDKQPVDKFTVLDSGEQPFWFEPVESPDAPGPWDEHKGRRLRSGETFTELRRGWPVLYERVWVQK